MSREDAQLRIRLPIELKEKIESLAKRNKRSMNAEIVLLIESALRYSLISSKNNYEDYTDDDIIVTPVHKKQLDFTNIIEKITEAAKALQAINDLTPEQESEIISALEDNQKTKKNTK